MNNDYLISVITPFHNVNMDYFADCEQSMRNQTIGFENIEWIIVVHNCLPHYLPDLERRFEKDKNVRIIELNNEYFTPSSPRNEGLRLSTAEYIGLLDADDCYTENCLEVVLQNAHETGAELVNVRREIIKDSQSVNAFFVKSLFNNTERRVVMENSHWDTEKLFGYMWGVSTSYFVKTSMLRQHHIDFDIRLLLAEDFLFTLHCIAHANRICFLNQFIGYRYLINENSLVQNPIKPAQTLLTYAKGLNIVFSTMRNYGFDTSFTVSNFLAGYGMYFYFCKDMTPDIRREIKRLLGDFVVPTAFFKPNKIRDEQELYNADRVISNVIMNPDKSIEDILKDDMDGINEMKSILITNKNTDFAKRNGFDTINSLSAYQFRVPLTNAAFYKPLIDLQILVGEVHILTNESLLCYLKKENGDLIPVSKTQIDQYSNALHYIFKDHKNILLNRSIPQKYFTNDDKPIDTLSSALIKHYFQTEYFRQGVINANFAAPINCYFEQSDNDDSYRQVILHSLAAEDVDQLVAESTKDVVLFFEYLSTNWEKLIEDCPCSENRKEQLTQIFTTGFSASVAQQIWPKLQRVVAFGAGEMYEWTNKMKQYTGGLCHNHGYYFTEVAMLGKAVADNCDEFECVKDKNFYELQPLDKDHEQTLRWSQVEVGKPYMLVVTNRSGLYRYATDHFICPQKVTNDSITFTVY